MGPMLSLPPMMTFARKVEALHPDAGGVGGPGGVGGGGCGLGGGGGGGGGAGGGGIGGATPCVGINETVLTSPATNRSRGPGVHLVRLRFAPVKSSSPPAPPATQPLSVTMAPGVTDSVILDVSTVTRKSFVPFTSWLLVSSTPAGLVHLLLS